MTTDSQAEQVKVRNTKYKITFLVTEVCNDGSVPEEDLRAVRMSDEMERSDMFDFFNRCRDAVGMIFQSDGPQVLCLVNAGNNKIQVIKAMRSLTGCGLKEAKDLVEYTPGLALMYFDDMNVAKKALKVMSESGATCRLRPADQRDSMNRPLGYELFVVKTVNA